MADSGQALGVRDLFRRWRTGRAARDARRRAAAGLWRAIVAQGRQPAFYAEWGVPDTPEGRFELIGLHAVLVLRRLRAAGRPGDALAQELLDLVVTDFDRSVREMGVGDLAVGKQVKRLTASLLARLQALDRPLAEGDAAAVTAIVERNLRTARWTPPAGLAPRLAARLLAEADRLAAAADAALLEGRIEPWAEAGDAARSG